MKIANVFSLLTVALFSWGKTLAVEGTIGFEGRDDICADGNGDLLCYNPGSYWPPGTDVCDCWDSSTGQCSFGNMSGNIGGGLNAVAEKEASSVAPPPTSAPPPTRTPPTKYDRRGDYRHLVEGSIGYEGRDDICRDGNGDFLCYDPNGLWPTGTTVCDCWDSSAGNCSLGNMSGNIGGGLTALPAEKEVSVVAPPPTRTPPTKYVRRGDYRL